MTQVFLEFRKYKSNLPTKVNLLGKLSFGFDLRYLHKLQRDGKYTVASLNLITKSKFSLRWSIFSLLFPPWLSVRIGNLLIEYWTWFSCFNPSQWTTVYGFVKVKLSISGELIALKGLRLNKPVLHCRILQFGIILKLLSDVNMLGELIYANTLK